MNKKDIAIVDYGVGNILSVSKALEHCGGRVKIISEPENLLMFSRVVLPGVGAFAAGMNELTKRGLTEAIKDIVNRGDKLLGICLGMQLLLNQSNEFGLTKGLGLINGEVVPIPVKSNNTELKIPHIGWNKIEKSKSNMDWDKNILNGITNKDSFYFVHSFMAKPVNSKNQLADSLYGDIKISAVIQKENVTGCQFHPEKSGASGLKFLKNFIEV